MASSPPERNSASPQPVVGQSCDSHVMLNTTSLVPSPSLCHHAITIDNTCHASNERTGKEALTVFGSCCVYLRWSFAGLGNLGDGKCRRV